MPNQTPDAGSDPGTESDLGTESDPAAGSAPFPGDLTVPHAARIAVVVGSTRPTRICRRIAEWLAEQAQAGSTLRYELLDLAEVNLPMLDEPLKAALRQYQHPHTRAWSQTVSAYDGFLFVFPQYNWGYPAVLKNALDYLYHEWHGKPATFATYGTRGGGKAAAQFSGVMAGLHMRELPEHLELVITDADVDDDWQLIDPAKTLDPYTEQLRSLDASLTAELR